MTYKEKMQQANREAKLTLLVTAVVVAAWALLGFGLEGCGIVVFSTPLWAIAGCVGTWLVAVAASIVVSRLVMKDIPLDDEDDEPCGT